MVKDQQSGQVFLIVLLTMVIALTVGLSIASRNVTNLRISQEEISSQRALAAAEAGIEQSLKSKLDIGATSLEPGITYSTDVNPVSNPVSGTQVLVNGGNVVAKDEGADIWLVEHNADDTPNFSSPWSGTITIYWGGAPAPCDNAAFEVVVISGTVASPVLRRYTYDPCSARRGSNNFGSPGGGGTVSGKTFSYSTTIPAIASGFVVRAIPLYFSATMGVVASSALFPQGVLVEATGQSLGTTHKLNVFKGYPQLPAQFFVYGLFSP